MSYTHQKVMWSSCKVNSYDEAIAQSRNGTCVVNQYGDIVRKEPVTIIARKQPHEEVTTIEDVIEPYLLQMGLLKRTARGRVVTDKAYEVLGIKKD